MQDYPRQCGSMLVKVAAVQARLGQRLTLDEKMYIFKQRPDFVCLPEYYLLDNGMPDYHRAALHAPEHLAYLQRLSDELSVCLIGGSVVEAEEDRLHNTCAVFNRGRLITIYRKRYPVVGEMAKGIIAGDRSVAFDSDGVRIGLMLCGDVFVPAYFEELRQAEVDLIFVPTTSPYRPDDSLSMKHHRDHVYFETGARMSGAFVVKTCGVGSLFNRPLQGRSLIAAPWGALERVEMPGEQHKRILVATLDLAEIREFRRKAARAAERHRGEDRASPSLTGS